MSCPGICSTIRYMLFSIHPIGQGRVPLLLCALNLPMNKSPISVVLKVITVDDSPIVSERLQSMLREMDQVEFMGNARNTSAALLIIDQHKPGAVILDIHLGEETPKVSGINLLIELKQKHQDMKIIMFTNLAVPQYRQACLALGADYFFDKSHDFEKIPEALKEIIQQRNFSN